MKYKNYKKKALSNPKIKKEYKRLIKEIDVSIKKDKLYTYKDVFDEDPK